MNFGECPYADCDEQLWLSVPDRTPEYSKIQCPKCNRYLWYKYSRLEPRAWTEKEFEDTHNINLETKTIERK